MEVLGGELSGASIHSPSGRCNERHSVAESLAEWNETGCNAAALGFSVAICSVEGVFSQHPCEEGICICPHSAGMVRQQARSAALICASGIMHAIAGAPTQKTSSRAATI